jgi:hypothetical protein
MASLRVISQGCRGEFCLDVFVVPKQPAALYIVPTSLCWHTQAADAC